MQDLREAHPIPERCNHYESCSRPPGLALCRRHYSHELSDELIGAGRTGSPVCEPAKRVRVCLCLCLCVCVCVRVCVCVCVCVFAIK